MIKKLDRQFRKLTKFHTRYKKDKLENILMLLIIAVDKKECLIEQIRDGMVHILFSLVILQKKSKDTEIIFKQIFKIIDKIKD